MKKVCDRDCFHCVFDDCILEELDASDYRLTNEVDEALRTAEQRKAAAYQREYRRLRRIRRAIQS